MHRLLERQLRKVGRLEAAAQDPLLQLVDAAYHEMDLERARLDRTHRALSEELELLNATIRDAAESRVRAVFDYVVDGIVVVDEAGCVDTMNPAAERIFGTPVGAPRAMALASLWGGHPPDLGAGTHEHDLVRDDGTTTPVELTVSACVIGDRRRDVIIVRDVSSVRQAAAMREAVVRAEAEARAKASFLASMSHEIRTPLNGVLGMATLLADSRLSPAQRSCVDTIGESGASLLALLDDILDLSRIEAGRMPTEHVEYSPVAVAERVVDLCAARATANGVSTGVVVGATVPALVRGDPGKLRQILTNLVGNATKFTSSGSIVVSVDHTASEDASGPTLVVAVADTGIGIAPNVVPRLFSEFEQADSSTTRRFGGTGLGLAISKRLAGMLGGTIEVTSELGRGSVFTCRVPATSMASAAFASRPLRAWLVDEDSGTRAIVGRQLETWGVRVEVVDEAAVVRLCKVTPPPELLVLSASLPDGGAGRVVGALRPVAGGPTRVVLLSRQLDEADALNVDAVLPRPVRPTALATQLQIAHAMAGRCESQPVAVAAVARQLRVLLVEDNPVNQKVAAAMLRRAGHTVHVAGGALDALAVIPAWSPDIVLMDLQMPTMDGLDATRLIRASEQEARRRLPIIGLTANAQASDREACLAAGMDDYLTKPVDRAQLLHKLQLWSAGARPSRTSEASVAQRVVLD